MFKNILVANDGSKYGNKAVDLAIDLAVKYDSKISALYVMDFASDLSYDELDDAGGAVLDEITAKGNKAGITVVEHIITASPVNDMETMIRKINPDIVVLGAHGTTYDKNQETAISKIGSVTKNALKVSKVPVIIVK